MMTRCPHDRHAVAATVACAFAAILALLVAGCTSAPPRPATVPLRVESAAHLNPDDQGRALSVVLRIYELRAAEPFHRAPYEALLRRDAQTLGATLVDRREIVVAPGDVPRLTEQPLAADTTHVAVMALYRRPDPQAFRQVFPVEGLTKAGIGLRLAGCGIAVTEGRALGAVPGERRDRAPEC